MSRTLLKTHNLEIGFYKNNPILESVNIEIYNEDLCCLIGSNGSGKTSFIKTLCKIYKPLNGSTFFADNISLSTVPQFKKIQFHYPITVKDFFFLDNNINFERTEIDLLLNISEIKNLLLRECSGGQLQKVLLARSILSKANLIFMDEPLDALDTQTKNSVLELLRKEAKNQNRAFFIITHFIDNLWTSKFNRIFYIEDKKILEKQNA
jgi:manganese/zinc/iron transport system ATP- binding protein